MPDLDSRQYPKRPICAVGAIVQKDATVLLVRRGKPPRLGEWSIPGGAVEIGETLEQAACREIREECGIDIAVHHIVEAVDLIQRDERGIVQYHYVVLDFAALYLGGELEAATDVTDAQWVPLNELDHYPLNPKTREVIRKGFA